MASNLFKTYFTAISQVFHKYTSVSSDLSKANLMGVAKAHLSKLSFTDSVSVENNPHRLVLC